MKYIFCLYKFVTFENSSPVSSLQEASQHFFKSESQAEISNSSQQCSFIHSPFWSLSSTTMVLLVLGASAKQTKCAHRNSFLFVSLSVDF